MPNTAAIDESASARTASSWPSNPVLWLVVGLPLLSVLASFASLALAITRGDSELPKSYHWEGGGLATDQAMVAAAARLRVSATIGVDRAAQRCTVALQGDAPETLQLILTHPTDSSADRNIVLHRSGSAYVAPCAALPAAHWWLQLLDNQGRWMLRGRIQGALQDPVLIAAPASAVPGVD